MAKVTTSRRQQRGTVLVLIGLSLAVLIGFLGLVIDLGRLFVTKTELQTAMDACALAAAAELRPNLVPTDTAAITRAVSAGLTAGNRNNVGFQGSSAALTSGDIYFSDRLSNNSTTFPFGYVPSSAASPATAKYAMCARAITGISTYFMRALESALGGTPTDKSVSAWATATTMPAQTACAIPLGMCTKGPAPTWGYTPGDWYDGRFDAGGGMTGNFNWIDFTPPAGGASELAGLLTGGGACNAKVGDTVGQSGILGNAAGKAWNSRFGVYQKGGGNPGLTTAPPDRTGYSYTPTNWPGTVNALPDFLAKRNSHASYGNTVDTVKAGNDITGLSVSNAHNIATHGSGGEHDSYGADRRLVIAPVIDCAAWASGNATILDWACVLMLHPIASPGDIVRMEYVGKANNPNTPCSTYGLAGGTLGPLVPTLVH